MRTNLRARAGFTLIELLVSMVVFLGILVAMFAVFNANYKLAQVQTHVANMQQSLRIAQHDLVRMVRMAGRGGLSRGTLPQGLAVAVTSNVPDGTTLGSGASPPAVVAGTDILTIRGVFSTPYYQVNPAGGNFQIDNPPSTGSVRIQDPNPTTGVRQDLEELAAAIEAATPVPDALMLVSPLDDSIYAVVKIDPPTSSVTRVGGAVVEVTLGFSVDADYLPLSPGGVYPPTLTNVAFVGILEEYRFYVRQAFAIPGDNTSELVPRLSMARFFPGTNDAYAGVASNLMIDVADNILDFQVALGVDTDDDDVLDEPTPPSDDEWLYNHHTDNDGEARWNAVPGTGAVPELFYVRLTTLARTDRPDFKYVSPAIDEIEDHQVSEPATPGNPTELARRRYRRWQLQTVVDLRNL